MIQAQMKKKLKKAFLLVYKKLLYKGVLIAQNNLAKCIIWEEELKQIKKSTLLVY